MFSQKFRTAHCFEIIFAQIVLIKNVIMLANLGHKDNLGTKLLIIIGYYCSNWLQMKQASLGLIETILQERMV